MATTVDEILNTARGYIGVREGTARHHQIIDTYNSIKPLPASYDVKYEDDWYDAFITVLAIQTGATDIIERECGVPRHIVLFKNMGIWRGGSSVILHPGYLITFDWEQDGTPDHIGIVESVSGGYVNTIEGNADDMVQRRSYPVGDSRILCSSSLLW